MRTSVFILFSVHAVFCGCVTLNLEVGQIIKAKRRIELKSFEIECQLTDMIIISAPIVKSKEIRYYLYKPNGDITKLNITTHDKSEAVKFLPANDYGNTVVDFVNDQPTILSHEDRYTVFNVNIGQSLFAYDDIFTEKLNSMLNNEFIIGPLNYDDHGNWVLCMFYKDRFDNWVEVFQVITVRITETVAALPRNPTLRPGDTFEMMFAYPIPNLQSCQLTAPISTFDRFYDRSRIKLDQCAFVVTNVTFEDAGTWKIIGVGKIVYETIINLEVRVDTRE